MKQHEQILKNQCAIMRALEILLHDARNNEWTDKARKAIDTGLLETEKEEWVPK